MDWKHKVLSMFATYVTTLWLSENPQKSAEFDPDYIFPEIEANPLKSASIFSG